MASTTFTVRIDSADKDRLEALAKNTGRGRSYLAAEAISEYLDVDEWQVAAIKRAMVSLVDGESVAHRSGKDWVASWGTESELGPPEPDP